MGLLWIESELTLLESKGTVILQGLHSGTVTHKLQGMQSIYYGPQKVFTLVRNVFRKLENYLITYISGFAELDCSTIFNMNFIWFNNFFNTGNQGFGLHAPVFGFVLTFQHLLLSNHHRYFIYSTTHYFVFVLILPSLGQGSCELHICIYNFS